MCIVMQFSRPRELSKSEITSHLQDTPKMQGLFFPILNSAPLSSTKIWLHHFASLYAHKLVQYCAFFICRQKIQFHQESILSFNDLDLSNKEISTRHKLQIGHSDIKKLELLHCFRAEELQNLCHQLSTHFLHFVYSSKRISIHSAAHSDIDRYFQELNFRLNWGKFIDSYISNHRTGYILLNMVENWRLCHTRMLDHGTCSWGFCITNKCQAILYLLKNDVFIGLTSYDNLLHQNFCQQISKDFEQQIVLQNWQSNQGKDLFSSLLQCYQSGRLIVYVYNIFDRDLYQQQESCAMLKVKIHKVTPISSQIMSSSISIKNQPIQIQGNKYLLCKNQQDNYTGYPVYLYLIIILPQNNSDYQYLKVDIRAENVEFNKLIDRKNYLFKDIKKGEAKREILFQYVPTVKGNYLVNVDSVYRIKYFVQGSQPPPQKRDNCRQAMKCLQPFQVKQKIVSQDNKGSITFPLFLQYTIQSKISNYDLVLNAEFNSEKLKAIPLHNDQKIVLKKHQNYFLMYKMQPKSVKQVCSQKGMTIGILSLKYGEKGSYQRKTSLKPTDKYLFFRGQTLTKHVPKKDIVQIQVKFSKLYNLNFNLGDLKLHISESQMPQIKILKTSMDKINLDKNTEVIVKLSIICMKSGAIQLQGISLQTNQSLTVYFINDMLLFVGMEPQHKSDLILQHTGEIIIEQDLI